jgi:hypothetical protein
MRLACGIRADRRARKPDEDEPDENDADEERR